MTPHCSTYSPCHTSCSRSPCGSSARHSLFRMSPTCPPMSTERMHASQQHLWPAHRNTRGLSCCMASASSAHSSAADTEAARQFDEAPHNRLSREEIERRIRKAANLMIAGDELAPFDRSSFNPALVLWYAVESRGYLPFTRMPYHFKQGQRWSCSVQAIQINDMPMTCAL